LECLAAAVGRPEPDASQHDQQQRGCGKRQFQDLVFQGEGGVQGVGRNLQRAAGASANEPIGSQAQPADGRQAQMARQRRAERAEHGRLPVIATAS
jgi:hypothetical protein